MTSIRDFEQVGTRGFYQPSGEVSIDVGFEMIGSAIARAQQLGLADIVINTLGFSGFSPPTVIDRYALAQQVVENAGGKLRVAFVVRPDLIDYQKIGMVMLQNRGIISDVFPSETAALTWLDALRFPK